ncbi:TetR/AcrR family transcriptional regulator [Mycolicibacterium tusciae]|uniref:TetR/AcrR family transcriptional regulator n=1 Tax=Mycolicibacterium tusciae TaxID=75922 RepID=UPI00024A2E4E|nr:TetR/AcrR family transcriptional regulator [Mycolicibacterium tusciae]
MPNRGWSGNAPGSDEEAIDRILDVADAIIAERGTAVRIADVARMLGVTRQTVYRYFPNTEELLLASGMRTADGFLDQLAEHTSGLTEPAAAIVEGIAFAVETLAEDAQFANLLRNGSKSGTAVSLTSDTARAFSRSMLHRCDVDWESNGYDEAALDELAELGLRTFHSILVDPGEPARDGFALRRFISRWLGPAVVYPRLTQVMEALQPISVRPQRSRPTASA